MIHFINSHSWFPNLDACSGGGGVSYNCKILIEKLTVGKTKASFENDYENRFFDVLNCNREFPNLDACSGGDGVSYNCKTFVMLMQIQCLIKSLIWGLSLILSSKLHCIMRDMFIIC